MRIRRTQIPKRHRQRSVVSLRKGKGGNVPYLVPKGSSQLSPVGSITHCRDQKVQYLEGSTYATRPFIRPYARLQSSSFSFPTQSRYFWGSTRMIGNFAESIIALSPDNVAYLLLLAELGNDIPSAPYARARKLAPTRYNDHIVRLGRMTDWIDSEWSQLGSDGFLIVNVERDWSILIGNPTHFVMYPCGSA